MSPVGLSVLEHGFDWFDSGVLPDGSNYEIGPENSPTSQKPGGWLVTRIQAFAGPDAPAVLQFGSHGSQIEPNGCLLLEPGGAFRDQLFFRGLGARLIVEYWYRAAAPTGGPPNIVIA